MILQEDVDFLAHFGVKGQKWGVRKDQGHEGDRAKSKKIDKLDKAFAENTNSFSVSATLYNRAAVLSNGNDIARINNKPQYKNVDFTKDSPLRQTYYKEHQDAFIKNVNLAAKEFGTNASGTKEYKIVVNPDVGGWDVVLSDVKHAANEEIEMHVDVEYKDGFIVFIKIAPKTLSHYGVKGQKWGVRRSSRQLDSASRARNATKDLTNDELRKLVDRMRLDQQYAELASPKTAHGRKYVKSILENSGRTFVGAFVGAVATQAVRKAFKAKD